MADRVLLITGASSGVGAARARTAAGAGWRVALTARSGDRQRALVDELGAADPVCVTREALRRSRGRLLLTGSLAARHVGSGSL